MEFKQNLIHFLIVVLFLTGCKGEEVTSNNVFLYCVKTFNDSSTSIWECEEISKENNPTNPVNTNTTNQPTRGFI